MAFPSKFRVKSEIQRPHTCFSAAKFGADPGPRLNPKKEQKEIYKTSIDKTMETLIDKPSHQGKVLSIIVTYHPDESQLSQLIDSIASQCTSILVIDNTPGIEQIKNHLSEVQAQAPKKTAFHFNGKNLGIGAAQNIGVEISTNEKWDFYLFLDQDSLPEEGMVAQLLDAHSKAAAEGHRIACAAPEYFDKTTNQKFRFQMPAGPCGFYRSTPGDARADYFEIVTAMSSGSLVSAEAFKSVGRFSEDFFIDHVDTEWCLRARAAGWLIIGSSRKRLLQTFSDRKLDAWIFGWRRHAAYPPLRLYYRFRNFIVLCKMKHAPAGWCLRSLLYWALTVYAHCIFGPARIESLRAIFFGILDGAVNRLGKSTRIF